MTRFFKMTVPGFCFVLSILVVATSQASIINLPDTRAGPDTFGASSMHPITGSPVDFMAPSLP